MEYRNKHTLNLMCSVFNSVWFHTVETFRALLLFQEFSNNGQNWIWQIKNDDYKIELLQKKSQKFTGTTIALFEIATFEC